MTTNSKPAIASISSVSRLGSFTHVPNVVGPGSSQPLGNSSHGIGYSSAFSTQPGRSEKSTRGGAKMSIS